MMPSWVWFWYRNTFQYIFWRNVSKEWDVPTVFEHQADYGLSFKSDLKFCQLINLLPFRCCFVRVAVIQIKFDEMTVFRLNFSGMWHTVNRLWVSRHVCSDVKFLRLTTEVANALIWSLANPENKFLFVTHVVINLNFTRQLRLNSSGSTRSSHFEKNLLVTFPWFCT